MVGVIVGVEHVITACPHRTSFVARFFQTGKDGEVDIQHIIFRPYGTTVVQVVLVIVVAVGSQFQGDDVLVIVAAVVATHTHEQSQLVVAQLVVADQVVGVYEHLHALIESQVEGSVAIDSLRLPGREVLNHHVQSLLVGFGQLRLRGVGDT